MAFQAHIYPKYHKWTLDDHLGGARDMAIHWSDYPGRVETFGGLTLILETLDHDNADDLFNASSFRNESEESAYTVHPNRSGYRFNPRLDRMPGLERLLDRFDIDGHSSLTIRKFRDLRRGVAQALKLGRAVMDAMTFVGAADLLDRGEACAATLPGPPKANPLTIEEFALVQGYQGVPVATPSIASPVSPASQPAPTQANANPTDVFMMADIRDLFRYQRELAAFEQWRLATTRRLTSPADAHTRTCELALNSPRPTKLDLERATGLAVYRRLVKASHDVFQRDLDEASFLYFVGEVADRHRRSISEMWGLSTIEFGHMMDCSPPIVASDIEKADPRPRANPADEIKTPERKDGGRPKLGEGANATSQDKALRNVYELIRRVYQPGCGPKTLLQHFRKDKGFKELVGKAAKQFDEQLFKNAAAWIKENPLQETPPGNVA